MLLVTIFVLLEIFQGSFAFKNVSSNFISSSILSSFRFPKIRSDETYVKAKEISDYLSSHCKKGDSILFDDQNIMKAVCFYSKDKFRLYSLPYIRYPVLGKRRHRKYSNFIEEHNRLPNDEKRCPIIFFWNPSGGPMYPDVFYMLTINALNDVILRENITYFIETKETLRALNKIPWFQKDSYFGSRRIHIIKISAKPQVVGMPLYADSRSLKVLKKFAVNDRNRYEQFSNHFFKKYLGWTFQESYNFAINGKPPKTCLHLQ